MSRLRRLKERKRKNRIKATSCGLALALVIGSAQGLGTYALFTDTEDVASELAISTGDVDVEVSKGVDFTEPIEPASNENSTRNIPITITNKGTLNQNINLELVIPEKIKSYLEVSEFNFDNITVKSDGVMYDKEDNSKLFVLSPGSSINGSIDISLKAINDKDTQNELAKKPHNINITVKARQINKSNTLSENGFYDIAIQENTINIAQKEVITIAIGEKAHYINNGGNRYTSLYIPVNVNGMTEENKDKINITATIKDSIASYKAEYVDKGIYKYIKIIPETNKYIEFQDALNITINIKVGEDEAYSQLCWVKQDNAGNSNCQEGNHPHGENIFRCQIQVVNGGHKTWNTLEEKPSEPEVVEPSKEEVEKPSESEVVDPPKEEIEKPIEPEVVEPPKEEITEIQKQPEAVEPPKETEGIQE